MKGLVNKMREIKFRGYRVYSGEWVYGDLIHAKGNLYVVEKDYFEVDGHHLSCNSDTPVFVDEKTIGQFIGLKDKNGKEIYEGDNLFDEYDEEYYVAEFENGVFVATGDGFTVDLFEVVKGCSVIGNIHDNKELLKGE
jgi:uncharacterized phage protein (TIGR01671 family)